MNAIKADKLMSVLWKCTVGDTVEIINFDVELGKLNYEGSYIYCEFNNRNILISDCKYLGIFNILLNIGCPDKNDRKISWNIKLILDLFIICSMYMA